MMKQKILMITMGLDIGGAETHIVELSKELKRRGYDILVASSGEFMSGKSRTTAYVTRLCR